MSLPKESDRRKSARGNDVGDPSTNGQGRASTSPMPMALPDVVGLSLGEAALAYAETGWYVLPVKPGSKSPGSVVGANWHEKSSRDPDQIRVWWSDNPDYGIAVHCGRSGAGAFDLDINELEQIARDGRPDIAEALRSAGAIQATRREGDRGHYIFRRACSSVTALALSCAGASSAARTASSSSRRRRTLTPSRRAGTTTGQRSERSARCRTCCASASRERPRSQTR